MKPETHAILWLNIALLLAIFWLAAMLSVTLTGCSSESIRQGNRPDLAPMPRDAEREAIRQRGAEFCATYPDDVACKGPKK